MNPETSFFSLLRMGLGTSSELEGKKHKVKDKRLGQLAMDNGQWIMDNALSAIDYGKLYADGIKQGTAAIQLDGLNRLIEQGHIPSNAVPLPIKMQLLSHTMQVERVHSRHREVIAKLARFYASHGISMMLLKGYGLSLLYPNPNHRPCGDIDIWLFGEQERADKLLHEELGVSIDEDHLLHTVFHIDGVMVENHYNFLSVNSMLSVKVAEGELHRQLQDGCEAIEVDGATVYLPPANFNALFLLRHAAGHFASAEIALRHVTDWAMFVRYYHDRIDWKWLYGFAKKQNLHRFLDCQNGLCIDYLGMSKEFFSEFVRDEKLEARVMEDILNPKYHDKSAIGGNPIRDYYYRLRRWWGQRWKYKLVYPEGLWVTFLVQLRSHFIAPKSSMME